MNVRSRRAVLLLPIVWLAVVVVVAGLTWRVIDAAGRGVLTSGASSPSPAAGATPDVDPTSGGASPRTSPRQEPRVTPSPRATVTPSLGPSGATSTGPRPSAAPSPSAPTAPASSSPAPAQPQVRSWQGSAGTVTTSCRGTSISLQSVTPNDGWVVEVDDTGPGRVRVELSTRGDDERETRVEAGCSGGIPRFEVRTDD